MLRRIVVVFVFMLMSAQLGHAADVKLELTYPCGKSPKVFTTGWLFGTSCKVGTKDISDQVQWSGTGKFSTTKGKFSRPTFKAAGTNTIILKVKVDGKEIAKKYTVTAVNSDKYACVGDVVQATCSHGCLACPHPVTGHIETGSKTVLVRGKAAARVGDTGSHAACCGANKFKITSGDSNVLIDGKPAARQGDKTLHCGMTIGKIGGKAGEGQQADGKYTGATNPPLCKGTLILNINGEKITGSYSGPSPVDKSVTITTTWTGTYSAANSSVKGSVSGSKKTSTKSESIGGSFEGKLGDGSISGTWYMKFRGETMSLPFILTKN